MQNFLLSVYGDYIHEVFKKGNVGPDLLQYDFTWLS